MRTRNRDRSGEHAIRILLVDDEPHMAESLKEWLESLGHAVDVSDSPEDAIRRLKEEGYAMVIADVVFESTEVRGDEFLLENKDLIRNAQMVVITGQGTDRIRRIGELQEKAVPVLMKGGVQFLTDLRKITRRVVREQRDNHLLQTASAGLSAFHEGEPKAQRQLLQLVRDLLVTWLKGREDSDSKEIAYGGRLLSPQMLLEEIERGTEIGDAHLDMFLDLIKHRLEI
jgi:DNA-binding NtrC family response regulator